MADKHTDSDADDASPATSSGCPREFSRGGEKAEWDTSPLYEPPAGPDNLSDGVVAVINSVVAASRSLRRRVASWRAGE